MFQSFQETADGTKGPERLNALRAELKREGLRGFVIPRADVHQGEYVAKRDERLAWLTGFTGSAGFCVALDTCAGVFIDGRYRVQVKAQVADCYTPVHWPEVQMADWLREQLGDGGTLGLDPWLHTVGDWRTLEKKLEGTGIGLQRIDNLVDRVWADQPDPPLGKVTEQPLEFAGESAADKIARLSATLSADIAVLTLPDSICWLLNIRGDDVPRTPFAHGFALLSRDGTVDLFMARAKVEDVTLGQNVRLHDPGDFADAVAALSGRVAIDPVSCPQAVADLLSGAEIIEASDPCQIPKACKNAAEIQGARDAHLRDAAAMVRFLAWLDRTAPGGLTEIDVVRALEAERRATNRLEDISFDTICGSGPHGAVVHYRVTEPTNRALAHGELLLVDSGGQYRDGTTDITRTIAIGDPGSEECANFTRVLRGMIAISRLRWPTGLAGRDLEQVARVPLWEAGHDYAHGTGHGVGSYMSVHEGPQRLARTGTVPLQAGMILSNEPGFYREGAYGIRIENLIVVQEAPDLPGASVEKMLSFQTLTYVPIDRRLIVADMLTVDERAWLNAYHADCLSKVAPLVDGETLEWLQAACAAL